MVAGKLELLSSNSQCGAILGRAKCVTFIMYKFKVMRLILTADDRVRKESQLVSIYIEDLSSSISQFCVSNYGIRNRLFFHVWVTMNFELRANSIKFCIKVK